MIIAVTSLSRTALETIEKLSHTLDFTDHASQIIHALVHVLDQSPELRPAAMETLCRMMTQLGQRYKIFIPMVKKVCEGRRMGGRGGEEEEKREEGGKKRERGEEEGERSWMGRRRRRKRRWEGGKRSGEGERRQLRLERETREGRKSKRDIELP